MPSPLLVNIAKLHFAENYHEMIGALQDISGGILVTAPGEEDLLNPETRPLIEKYLGGREGVSAADRLRALNMISELTASDFGGYQAVLAIHAEGSIEAEKMTIHREYDFQDSLKLRQIRGPASTPEARRARAPASPGCPRSKSRREILCHSIQRCSGRLLGRFATGVTVITTCKGDSKPRHDGERLHVRVS